MAFPAGVLAVHQLRYLFAYGSNAGSELSAHGDRYVTAAAVVAAVLVVVSLGVGLLSLSAAWRGREHVEAARAPLWLLWLGLTLALIVGFCAVEGLEILLEPHRSGGVAGVLGDGGWWAVPAAALVAALLALAARGARALLLIATRARLTGRIRTNTSQHPRLALCVLPPAPMASCAAGRAPPVTESL